ncbi:MAG: M23 family metallopeptidase [Hoylesella enoeca]|uniref:M23 family metallopeptidase n=1 Tax=Hoylesella enoeca TaxID=76123 RepID=UPI003FA02A6A
MKINPRYILATTLLSIFLATHSAVKNQFTTLETQQISIPTPGLFTHSDAFNIDLGQLRSRDYSFPLPVGKIEQAGTTEIDIITSKGDAVKAMFDGVVRLSRNTPSQGNVIVIRHDNGLETVYARNAQNLVTVGQGVKAGQTIAIVGGDNKRTFCRFSVMINGGKINPDVIFEAKSHRLRKHVLRCEKRGSRVNVTVEKDDYLDDWDEREAAKQENERHITENETPNKLNLSALSKRDWSYPLPGSHVISPYGGKRRHPGVDIKTKPNDDVLAAFDGVVTRSSPYFGYGNCIIIKHSNGLETLYSHQSKNFVKVGNRVKAGQVIGLTGRTGRATTEHLHFEVYFKGRRIDPAMVFDHLNKILRRGTLIYSNGKVRKKEER